MNFKKTVVITGASRGIGEATAKLFASKGYNVVLNYNRSYESAKRIKSELIEKGYVAEIIKADITKREQVNLMIKNAIDKFGKIDVLVNNAGISKSKLFTDMSSDEWDEVIEVNLKGVFNCTQEALKYMLPRKEGCIINVSSMWGEVGASCEVHYSASKAGVIGLTKALAKELGPSGIRVNCIAPGIIDTDMMKDYKEETINELKNQTPLKRIGSVQDIADSIFFISSADADFITGQVLGVNGGFVI